MNNLRNLLMPAILLALALPAMGHAADPVPDYETTIPGYWLSRGLDMVVDDQGNAFLIASWYEDHHTLDFLVIGVDADGTPIWTVSVGADNSAHDYPTDIALDANGDVWITGWTDSENFPIVNGLDDTLTGFRDAFVMKFSSEDGTILYSTLLGGDYTDEGRGITISETGEVYVVGSTGSTDFPTTPDAYQGEPSFPLYFFTDAFITVLSPSGDEILYSTYFGGLEDDTANNVALDGMGNIVFAGTTTADDFPLVNPIQSDPNDIFVSKLSADGSTLLFSTYLGGEDIDRLTGMAMGPDGTVYLTGPTRSITFPTTPGAYQEDFIGEILGCEVPFGADYNCEDVFVTRMGTDGTGLVYSTFLGGSTVDESRDIVVDSQGRAYVVGYTYSDDFPPNGIDFSAEIFVSRFDPTGSTLDYSYTVDSGSANAGHGVAVDNSGGVYFTGAINVPADIYLAKIIDEVVIPNVTVSIFSSMSQVPQNSNFLFDVEMTNHEVTAQTLRGWTAAQRLPSGPVQEPLIGPARITLQPGETRMLTDIPQFVGNVPLGNFRYYARIGEDFPGLLWDEDFLEIEVVP